MKKYQWGIVGLGTIAHEFAESFNQETSELTAVASELQKKRKTSLTVTIFQKLTEAIKKC